MVETFWIPLLIPNDLPVCNLSNCERQAKGALLQLPVLTFRQLGARRSVGIEIAQRELDACEYVFGKSGRHE